VLGEDMGCGGEVKAQNSQGWCRGVGRDMVQVGSKFGARPQSVSQARRRKVVVTVREKHSGQKENDKKQKKTTEKKKKKNEFFFFGAKLASTSCPSHKAPRLALWTIGAARFRLSISPSTDLQFI
jgi:hypothetical protein